MLCLLPTGAAAQIFREGWGEEPFSDIQPKPSLTLQVIPSGRHCHQREISVCPSFFPHKDIVSAVRPPLVQLKRPSPPHTASPQDPSPSLLGTECPLLDTRQWLDNLTVWSPKVLQDWR